MRTLIALTSCLALAAALSAPGFAAAASGGATMKECAAQWQMMKKDNKTGGQTYKDFSSSCMAKGASAATATPAAKPVAATKLTTASTATKTQASTASAPGQRMKDCGAKWQSLKAANKTGGQTYQQFSKTCLSAKG